MFYYLSLAQATWTHKQDVRTRTMNTSGLVIDIVGNEVASRCDIHFIKHTYTLRILKR